MIDVQNIKYVPVILPAAAVNNDDWVGARDDADPVTVDTMGFDYATFVVQLGVIDADIAEFTLSESDDDQTYADITGAGWTSAALPQSESDSGEAWAIHVNLNGRKRYFQINLKAGDNAGSYATAFALLSRAKQAPDTAAERGFAAEIIV